MKERKPVKHKLEVLMGWIMMAVFVITVLCIREGGVGIWASSDLTTYTVVIDPGHGGYDPGKVGKNDVLEKDLNLSIAKKLKAYLESQGIRVLLTREEDVSLNEEDVKSKKASDMAKRIEIINGANPDVMVSIHQNSYTSANVKGAQAFYYSGSEEGKQLAEAIQDSMKTCGDKENKRNAKANDSYYMLLRVKCPAVITECGFLSNPEEAVALCDDFYQDQLAEAIGRGIVSYLKE